MVDADVVDPSVDLVGVEIPAGLDLRIGLGDHLGCPDETALLFLRAFDAGGGRAFGAQVRVNGARCSLTSQAIATAAARMTP